MKHTRGPWSISHLSGEHDCAIVGKAEKDLPLCVAQVFLPVDNGGTKPETRIANANLIAAAPELLEALKGLHGALSRMIDKHDPDSIEAEWLSHSHEAITKAEGLT